MSDNTLLRRHAERWAQEKNRPFDGDLLETVVDMRQNYDDRGATSWPAGSVEALLLERWPAHGPLDLPNEQVLGDTLDTYWRFLRSTGRMASGSAAPADLAKEARRALPKMAAACSDRTKFSTGRMLQEFGRGIGISLDEDVDVDELKKRLERITAAWNDLPTEERKRLLPDPSSKTARGQAMTDLVNAALRADPGWVEGDDDLNFLDDDDFEDDDDGMVLEPGNLAAAAEQVRGSAYVRSCLALGEWVGDGREVTKTGVPRPAVAREAYDALGLAEWDAEFGRTSGANQDLPEQAERLLAASRDTWHSARDCVPLDRLWYPLQAVGLVQIGSQRASWTTQPDNDTDWLMLGVTLVYAMTHRFDVYYCEPLVALTFSLAQLADASCDLDEFRQWWRARSLLMPPDQPVAPDLDDMLRHIQDVRLNDVLAMYADTGIWVRADDRLTLTDFGRDFAILFAKSVEEGYFGEDDDEVYLDQVLDYLEAEPFTSSQQRLE